MPLVNPRKLKMVIPRSAWRRVPQADLDAEFAKDAVV
jgi:hypothetical protein